MTARGSHHQPTPIATVRCPIAPELVCHIRNFVYQCAICLRACEDTAQTAKLLASELVSNAVRHTALGTPVQIEVLHDTDCHLLMISVEDTFPVIPAIPGDYRPSRERECGWGLPLVSGLADDYGITPLTQGKRVWFALKLAA